MKTVGTFRDGVMALPHSRADTGARLPWIPCAASVAGFEAVLAGNSKLQTDVRT